MSIDSEDYFAQLHEVLRVYLKDDEVEKCQQAFLVAQELHHGQSRRSGEPYITHPVAAALILAEMRLDHATIMATLLHDVVEDTKIGFDYIEQKFGSEVCALVEGVTKLTQIRFESREEAQAENFRKMILAMVKDIRVIIVKLADRFHNMKTLGALSYLKRKRIALETLEIYAPIANRLGMHSLYTGLEDLGFKALYPMRHRVLQQAVEKSKGKRHELMHKIEQDLSQSLNKLNIPYEQIFGRQKHLYSIYKKMRLKRSSFSEITDVFALRVITENIDACYRVLGALHNTYKPVPQKFKDYIGIPKVNGYQSLHTTLFGPYGIPLEVQIRTKDMNYVAETGVAAHWIYKASGVAVNAAQLRARDWVHRLLEMQDNTINSIEFIENVKIDLFPDEVYVFTPKGHIMELPKGATPVDFAYAVHSDIGNHCVAAKVNRRVVPLSAPLENGQTVEIITTKIGAPNPNWLNFVVTGKARGNIKNFIKNRAYDDAVAFGYRLIEQAFTEIGSDYNKIPNESMKALLTDLNYTKVDDLLYELGTGQQVPMVIAKKLVVADSPSANKSKVEPLVIKGTEGMILNFAHCCQPIPGDPIIGVFQRGRGIIVHVSDCKSLKHNKNKSLPMVSLCWDEGVSGDFLVDIVVDVKNQRGVLASLAAVIAEADANINDINIEPQDGQHNAIHFTICVKNKTHLTKLMRRIRTNSCVLKLYRNNTLME